MLEGVMAYETNMAAVEAMPFLMWLSRVAKFDLCLLNFHYVLHIVSKFHAFLCKDKEVIKIKSHQWSLGHLIYNKRRKLVLN